MIVAGQAGEIGCRLQDAIVVCAAEAMGIMTTAALQRHTGLARSSWASQTTPQGSRFPDAVPRRDGAAGWRAGQSWIHQSIREPATPQPSAPGSIRATGGSVLVNAVGHVGVGTGSTSTMARVAQIFLGCLRQQFARLASVGPMAASAGVRRCRKVARVRAVIGRCRTCQEQRERRCPYSDQQPPSHQLAPPFRSEG